MSDDLIGKHRGDRRDRKGFQIVRSEEPAAYTVGDTVESDPGPLPESSEPDTSAGHDAAAVIGNAVMYAAMSWVACCIEQQAPVVTVATLGNGLFDAEVTLADGSSCYLRVTLILETGPRLRTLVEPIHP